MDVGKQYDWKVPEENTRFISNSQQTLAFNSPVDCILFYNLERVLYCTYLLSILIS